jgi:hypothetical protein
MLLTLLQLSLESLSVELDQLRDQVRSQAFFILFKIPGYYSSYVHSNNYNITVILFYKYIHHSFL